MVIKDTTQKDEFTEGQYLGRMGLKYCMVKIKIGRNKIAGILTEQVFQWLGVGMGVSWD